MTFPDYLVVGYGEGRVYHDSAEHLIVYIAVKMFHKLFVGKSGVCLQEHKGNLCRRAEDVPASQPLAAFAIRSNGNTE